MQDLVAALSWMHENGPPTTGRSTQCERECERRSQTESRVQTHTRSDFTDGGWAVQDTASVPPDNSRGARAAAPGAARERGGSQVCGDVPRQGFELPRIPAPSASAGSAAT